MIASLLLAIAGYLLAIRVDSPRAAAIGLAAAAAAGFGARLASGWTGRVLLALGFVAPAAFSLALGEFASSHTLWLVPLAAWLALAAPTAGWSLPPRWRSLLVAWSLAVAACWPIVFLRELDWTPSLLFSLTTSNGRAFEPPWQWAQGVASAALTLLVGILWLDWLAGRQSPTRRTLAHDILLPAAAGLGVACLVASYQAWIDPSWLSSTLWQEVGRAPGPFFDANAMGMVAATWGVVLAGLIWSWGGGVAGAGGAVAALAIGWLGVLASGSRTAFAAGAVGTLFVAAGALYTRRAQPWKLAAGAGALVVVVGLSLLAGGPSTVTPLQRLAVTLPAPSVEGARAFAHAMWHRDGWGSASAAAIVEHPVTGVGVGTFTRQSVDYHFRLTGGRLPPDNAQNWWRQEIAEWGLVGAVITISWTILVGLFLLRGRTRRAEDTVAAAGVRGAILGLAFASLLGVPSQVPLVAFSFWTFLFLAWYLLESSPPERPPWRWAGAGVLALVVFAVGAQAYAATHDLRPPVRAAKVGIDYGHGFWRGGQDAAGEPFWWAGADAVFVFPLPPGVFEFRATPMHPDIAGNPVRVEMWLGGAKVTDLIASDPTPITLRIPVPEGERAVFIETRVSRTYEDERGRARGLRIQKSFTPR